MPSLKMGRKVFPSLCAYLNYFSLILFETLTSMHTQRCRTLSKITVVAPSPARCIHTVIDIPLPQPSPSFQQRPSRKRGNLRAFVPKREEYGSMLPFFTRFLVAWREPSNTRQVAPLSGSCTSLKRLVETHLREKEQAAEMLKGYVTCITREVSFKGFALVGSLK